MKKVFFLLFLVSSIAAGLSAQGNKGGKPHLSPTEFREKQQAFVTEQAELTKEEATKFFPLYFQLQDKKKELNDKAWELLRMGKGKDLSDAQYNEIMNEVYDTRIDIAQLEKNYYTKFQAILTSKQLYEVQRAEMRFHRELLKGMNKRVDPSNKRHDSSHQK